MCCLCQNLPFANASSSSLYWGSPQWEVTNLCRGVHSWNELCWYIAQFLVLAIAQSDRERECLRYAVYRASGLTSTAARRYFGFEDMKDPAKCVEDCLHDALLLREAVKDLSHTQEKAVLRTLGIEDVNSSSDSEAKADSTDKSDSEVRFEV